MLTHALAKFLPVKVHDGHIVEFRDEKPRWLGHSWLTRKGGDPQVIIDPAPLGSLSGPALVIQDIGFHYSWECSFLEHRGKIFKTHVASLAREIKKILKA